MEQLNVLDELENPFKEHNSQKMLHIYQMVQSDNLRDSLAYMLLATNESYTIADRDSARVVQQKVKTRTSYAGRSGRLMDYSFDENVDQATDDILINLLTSAINDYLSDKQELPDNAGEVNKVKVLMMQLIAQRAINIISDLNIPPYVADMVKTAEDMLEEGLDNTFNSWCMDLEETGNEHLVDWMRKEVGPIIFGIGVETKAIDKYNQYMSPYLGTIKNPKELYDRYKKRRDEYATYITKINYSDMYEIFELTANQFNKVQKNLFNDFQKRYSENVNAKYIKELLNGKRTF
jgi:transaldolase